MDFATKYDSKLYVVAITMIIVCPLIGMGAALFAISTVSKIKLGYHKLGDSVVSPDTSDYDSEMDVPEQRQSQELIYVIYKKIQSGATVFLKTEFMYLVPILVIFDSFLILMIGLNRNFITGVLAGLCFLTGSFSSLLAAALGMAVSTYVNARTTVKAQTSLKDAFHIAFVGSMTFGLFLPSMAVLVFFSLSMGLKYYFVDDNVNLYHVMSCYALGASMAGLSMRIGGGIFTKGADVGADMVGKVEANLNEDDPRNPAVIADQVGDSVGDISGMSSDLYGSAAEVTAAAVIMIANTKGLAHLKTAVLIPLILPSVSILAAILTCLFATTFKQPRKKHEIESSLKLQIIIFAVLMIGSALFVCMVFLPSSFLVNKSSATQSVTTSYKTFLCVSIGVAGGLVVGLLTEYYTSSSYSPVLTLAESAETGPATVIIFGIALGYKSCILPVISIGIMMYTSYFLADFFGVVMMGEGLASFLAIILTIDAYGPICDNAGGIAEMAGLHEEVRERTDILDAAGNTTAAIGKGFAINLSYVTGMALLNSYVTVTDLQTVNILSPFPLLGLFIGASYPFLFSAYLMQAVGYAAATMVKEVRRQFRDPEILSGNKTPDHEACISVATKASILCTVLPLLLTMSPILIGFLLGHKCLAGFCVGVMVSGVPVAIASNNSGGAWDNAKKYIEAGGLGPNKGKNSEVHYASVIGDTVGDPLKDTSGPSINTLIKIVAILSLVFSMVFPKQGYLELLIS